MKQSYFIAETLYYGAVSAIYSLHNNPFVKKSHIELLTDFTTYCLITTQAV